MLTNKKTYIAAAIGVLYAIFAFLTGHIDANGAMQLIEVAAASAGLRSAIANK